MEQQHGEPSAGAGALVLSAGERAMLDLEAVPFKYAGAKQDAIRARLQLSTAAYYQRLNRLIETEAALAYDPQLVRRLREARPRGADAVRSRLSAAATVAPTADPAPTQATSAQEHEEPHA